jgi:hypothetical protein
MGPWSFWTSRANSDPLPVKSRQDSKSESPIAGNPEPSWSGDDKVYATSAPGGWEEPIGQPIIVQPADPVFQPFGRPFVLNRMDSPVQEPDDSVSSIIRGVHEDEMRELVAVIKELREQAAKDAELIAELRGQAEDNARAIGVIRIENERLMKELSSAASEARAAAAAATAQSSPKPLTPPTTPKEDEKKRTPKQVPPVPITSTPKATPATPPFIPNTTNPPPPLPSTTLQTTLLSTNLSIFETYDSMIDLLKSKPRPDIQLADYPWPMFPDLTASFPPRLTLRSDVKKEKVHEFVQAYASAYGSAQRKERGEAMLKAWQLIMNRSEDSILKGTAARAFTYMDMAARSL